MNVKNEVYLERIKALDRLIDLSNNWNKDEYTEGDFMLANLLRRLLNKPMKEIGKPPYDNLEL